MSLRISQTLVLLQLLYIVTVSSQGAGCPGTCVNIKECPALFTLLQQIQSGTALPGSVNILRRAICRFNNNVPLVCCSSSPSPTTPVLPLIGSTGPSVPLRGNLLPTQCGRRPLVDRIVGGEDAPLRGWPWIALLEAAGSGNRSSVICGGTLISERYVLTAAHCVDTKIAPRLTNVRLGEHTLRQNPDCVKADCAPPYQSFGVEEIIIHEQYGFPRQCSRCNDIALIRLDRPVQLNSLAIQPICLPQNFPSDLGFSRTSLNTKQTFVAGWGITDFRSVSPSNVLQQVRLSFSESLCSLDLQVYPNRDMVLCAGGNRQDTCRGDSGGPMIMGNFDETQYYLIGVVSKGPVVCGAASTAGLYTSVDFYIPWITQKMRL